MNPFEHLGIEPSDDEREIKRAYARRLRMVRPDDDPVGFQVLHEAYQYCLGYAQQLRWQAFEQAAEQPQDDDAWARGEAGLRQHDDGPHDDGPHDDGPHDRGRDGHAAADSAPAGPCEFEHARVEPATALQQPESLEADDAPPRLWPEFDFDAFMSELLQRAAYQSSDGLRRWLQQSEPLYSLDLKLALRAPVSQVLAEIERPLPVETTQAIFEFFSLDVVDPHDAWLHEHALQAHTRAESSQRFKRTLEALQSPRVKPVDRLLTRELIGPWHRGRRLFVALVPLLPTRLMHAFKALQGIDPEQAQSQLDPGNVAFWRAATDATRFSRPRLGIVAIRMFVYYALAATLMSALVHGLSLYPPRDLGLAFAVWLGWAGAQAAFLRWVPTAVIERLDALSVFFTLGLVGAACLAPTSPVIASGLALVIVMISSGEPSPVHQNLAHYASYAICAGLGVCLFLATASWALTIPYALIGTGAIHVVHSFVVAWRRGISVPEARQHTGSYWYLVALSGLAIAFGLYKFGLYKMAQA